MSLKCQIKLNCLKLFLVLWSPVTSIYKRKGFLLNYFRIVTDTRLKGQIRNSEQEFGRCETRDVVKISSFVSGKNVCHASMMEM